MQRTLADPDLTRGRPRPRPRPRTGVDAPPLRPRRRRVRAMRDHRQLLAADEGPRLGRRPPDDLGHDGAGGDHEDVESRAGRRGGDEKEECDDEPPSRPAAPRLGDCGACRVSQGRRWAGDAGSRRQEWATRRPAALPAGRRAAGTRPAPETARRARAHGAAQRDSERRRGLKALVRVFGGARRTSCSTTSGIAGSRSRGRGGASLTCLSATATSLSAVNGTRPVSISKSTTPAP